MYRYLHLYNKCVSVRETYKITPRQVVFFNDTFRRSHVPYIWVYDICFFSQVKESAKVGYTVGAIAMTSDFSENEIRVRSSVRYSLTSASPRNPYGAHTDAFDIDKSSGSLVVARSLDRETQAEFRLEVRALDNSASNNPQSSAVTIRVEVEDVNDNAPKWPSNPILLELSEDMPVSSVVSNITATDADFGPNADMRYSLVKTFPQSSTFAVDSLTGIVTLNAALDFEQVREHIVVVRATDQPLNASERLSTAVTFIVKVLDANDFAPVFVSPSQITTSDRSAPGSVIGKVIAVDKDSGESGRVRYSVDDVRVAVNADSGLLTLSGVLKKGVLMVNVTASDFGRPSLKTVLPLKIVVKGGAGNPPKFLKSSYVANVLEDVPVGTFVARMEAATPGPESGKTIHLFFAI